MSHLRMTQEELDALQARIKASSASVQTHSMRPDDEATAGAKLAKAARAARIKERDSKLLVHMAEAAVLRECLRVLNDHPKVAFFFRQNTGGMYDKNQRFVKFAFKGCSDILGMSTGGRFIAVECKATGKAATATQQAFLDNVSAAGGFAVCCDHPQQLALALKGL